MSASRHPASYRDPRGFIFRRDGNLYRQIAASHADAWAAFTSSSLAGRLTEAGRLLPWSEASLDSRFDDSAWAVIRPQPLDFVSYPWEWTFGELRDAALLTLDVQTEALQSGMSLRDASAYNVQFQGLRPTLIDHLSFEPAVPDAPWIAYRQFCEHFLAPLSLMALRDVRMGRMLRDQLEGIPLDLAARLLPGRTRWRLGLGSHIHLHARSQRKHGSGEGKGTGQVRISTGRLLTLIESLRATVTGLRWEPSGTEWADYADRGHASYDDGAEGKARVVGAMVAEAGGSTCWDLGANTGRFSRVAADQGRRVLAFDIDPAAAERHYRALVREGRTDITPLVMDLADPSPSVGWAERERAGLIERADADVILALALVHHLAIGRNVPLPMVMDLFADLAPHAIVEWVPRGDPMVDVLLASREDIFDSYTDAGFEAALAARFTVVARVPIAGSPRVLYHLQRRS